YMSPEQCRGDPLDRRSDLFALGIVLYELATLKRAFDGAGEFAVMNQIVNHDIEPPSKRAPVPKEIEAIIMGLLVRDRERRYSTSREVQRAFDAAASMLGLSATPAAIAAEMASLFGSRPYPWALETVASVDPTDAGSSSAAPALNDTPAIEETAATVARARPPRELGSAVPRRNWLGVVAGVAVVSTAVFLLNPRCDGQPSTAATPSLAPVESSKSVAQHPVPQTKPTADPGLATTTPDEPIETEGAKPPPAVPPAPRRSPARRRGSPRGKVGKPRPVEPAEPSKPTFDPDAPAPRPR
ncbi:MAG: hypothetical protein JKY37_24235, partial [Nannocystaceae bacterium]|nr:hypothetical protein [Nannocystaceae bacterium]